MKRSSEFLLLTLCLVARLAETNGIIVLNAGFIPEIAQKEWYVLFTTPTNANLLESGRVHCGGALVAQDIVLTAAHCFDKFIAGKDECERDLSRYTAWVGRQAMSCDNGDIGRAFALENVYWDSRYNPDDERNLHDYALVKIVELDPLICDRGSLVDNKVFATYAETNVKDTTFETDSSGAPTGNLIYGDRLDLYGFGRYLVGLAGPTAPRLLGANGTKFNDYICDLIYDGDDFASRTPYQLCVYPQLSCFGDSGGALVFGDDIIGIASFILPDEFLEDAGFCVSVFEFYTKIKSYKDDIFATICAVSVSPPTSCRTARISDYEGISTGKDIPVSNTLETMAQTALETVNRVGRSFWGDWFN